MQVLIPISGQSTFFPKHEYYFPKPLIEIAGRPMIALVIEQLRRQLRDPQFVFVVDREDTRSFSLDRTLMLLSGASTRIVEKPGPTSGALCSCLLAIDALDLGQPLIVVNSDQLIDEDLSDAVDSFVCSKAAAGVITFDSVHPRWSYIVNDEHGNVAQTFEKHVVSRNAIAGFYYFETALLFIEAAKRVLFDQVQTEGLYYISSVLNAIILDGGKVLHHPISVLSYHSFYAPSKINEFERTDLAASLRQSLPSDQQVNVVIPAAGEGSRFSSAGWKKPKPFIDVDGRPMLEHVICNVTPRKGSITLLLQQNHLNTHHEIVSQLKARDCKILPVSSLTEGTASTVLLARRLFDKPMPLMVANSDQLVAFDVNHFIDDCITRKLDGSILVFRDPSMNPKWSYVKLDAEGFVTEVAEKRAISDIATVGIYFFRRGCDFVDAALDMILANDRVNNEFYTAPVYNYMIKIGARIGVSEVPMHAMAGLGTPEDLASFLKLRGAPASSDRPNDT